MINSFVKGFNVSKLARLSKRLRVFYICYNMPLIRFSRLSRISMCLWVIFKAIIRNLMVTESLEDFRKKNRVTRYASVSKRFFDAYSMYFLDYPNSLVLCPFLSVHCVFLEYKGDLQVKMLPDAQHQLSHPKCVVGPRVGRTMPGSMRHLPLVL